MREGGRFDLLVDSTFSGTLDRLAGRFYCWMRFIQYDGRIPKIPANLQGATYQRLVNKMFKDLIEKTMEVYVDDMQVKCKEEVKHLNHLQAAFEVMRKYGMKLNPTKCTFGVRGGKFLGYMVSEKGIEANLEKIKAIMQMALPKMIKDVQKLTVVSEDVVSSALVREEVGYQTPIYYVGKILQDVEKKYIQVEKLALALVTTVSRGENTRVDALSKFRTMIIGVKEKKITVMIRDRSSIEEGEIIQCVEEERSWKSEIEEYLVRGTKSKDPIAARRLKFRANRFTILKGELYRSSAEGPLLKMFRKEDRRMVQGTKSPIELHSCQNPQANGQMKVSNRVLLQHLKTKLNGAKGSWVEELPGVLWAYRRDTVLLGLQVRSSNTYGDR
ncbi:UNVERIFIED_CONTAM: hypothetical protein Scaly_2197900 [Sesamum calycinum]|uniref:Reverse transcriptase domain-containing protein n=1 Tax=Sesamum calycinum TaxID=2727403 RepID=A0AAW2MQE4_9LAMI